ncbi:MAG: lactate utilization protein, partial [Oscillospiraceae bacterium]
VMDKSAIEIRNEKLAVKVVAALQSRQFEAYFCESGEQAVEKALSLVDKEMQIAWGGSATLDRIGLVSRLRSDGYKLIDRSLGKTREEQIEIQRRALLCDTFFMSANAISEDGQLVNVDGSANRVAALCYGPKSVIIIAGVNKIARSAEDAMVRARTKAAPINAQRFGGKTPCTLTGACGDCKSPDCICAQIVTTRFCKPAGRIKVIIVGEELGF